MSSERGVDFLTHVKITRHSPTHTQSAPHGGESEGGDLGGADESGVGGGGEDLQAGRERIVCMYV